MLNSSGRRWPTSGDWVMQPKWDGFRLLIDVDRAGRVQAWVAAWRQPHPSPGVAAQVVAAAPAASIFDGEFVAIAERAGQPVQDFATVSHGVFTNDMAAAARLQFVGFDVLRLAGEDLRARAWRERDERLRAAPSGLRPGPRGLIAARGA